MAMKIARILLLLCGIAALLYSPRLLFSCGPFFPSTIFTYTWHPDFPLDRFARGELGVLQPTYARSYLAVAYRYLSGVGLDAEAQKAVQALWQERLDLRWNADGQDGIQRWRDARNAVPGVSAPPEIDIYRAVTTNEEYSANYLNCRDDVTDWILIFQGPGKATGDYALHKWNETASLPWLVASLAKIDGQHPQTPALLAAADKVTPTSAAFPTVAFHRLRLLVETGDKEHAHEQLDALLSSTGSALPPSSRNLFLALRMPLSRSLDEWLTYAQRVPASIFYDEDGRELPGIENNGGALKEFADGRTFFDKDATQTLNHSLPVNLLTEVAVSEKLPLHLRRELALAAWVRAAVLDDTESGKKLASTLVSRIPALRQNLEAYLAADNSEVRKFAAVFLMLHFPGTRPYIGTGVSRLTPLEQIDNYRDNWWCSFAEPGELDTPNFLRLNRIPQMTPDSDPGQIGALTTISPAFLDQAQQKTAEQEWQRLTNLGVAPNYFTRQVIDWAQKHQHDQRVPEALYLAVRSTRYGCTDEQSSVFSKQAFQLLHRRYPDSSWAKKTPYWY